jgi:hypothetical protein
MQILNMKRNVQGILVAITHQNTTMAMAQAYCNAMIHLMYFTG